MSQPDSIEAYLIKFLKANNYLLTIFLNEMFDTNPTVACHQFNIDPMSNMGSKGKGLGLFPN